MGALVELVAGTIFAEDFRVVRLLSDGGMGSVYVVEQLSTGAERALKLMHGRLANDQTMRRRFETEARVGSRIDSAHVVHVVAAGVDRDTGAPWLAMELLVGEDLNDYARRVGPLTPDEVRLIFEQLCHALGAAHEAGIVHRDLKLENIFLARVAKVGTTSPYEVKVLDFGIAKLTAEFTQGTDSGNTDTIGTPAWMAPEQTELGSTIVPATDVWALGLIAFRLLTGKQFWRSSNLPGGSTDTLLREILYEPIPSASERATAFERAYCLPPGFDAWFERCVVRAQQARFVDARAAWEVLDPILSSQQGAGLPDTARWFKGEGGGGGGGGAYASGDRNPRTGPPPPPSRHPSRPPSQHPSQHPPNSNYPPPRGSQHPSQHPSGAASHAVHAPWQSSAGAAPSQSPARSRRALGMIVGAALLLVLAFGLFKMRQRMGSGGIDPAAFSPLPTTTAVVDDGGHVDASSAAAPIGAANLVDNRPVVQIPGGTFSMGSKDGEDDERPVHPITLPPFEIDVTEVTVAAYKTCVQAGRCTPSHDGDGCNAAVPDRDTHPINCVDWTQATAYCHAHGKRLPSEEEWELTARGTVAKANHTFPWGAAAPKNQLCWNGEGNSEGKGKRSSTCIVGTPEGDKSPYGALGMAGNVSEWTASHYCPYSVANCTNPQRVVRGATWADFAAASFRTTYRTRSHPGEQNVSMGFRCARTP